MPAILKLWRQIESDSVNRCVFTGRTFLQKAIVTPCFFGVVFKHTLFIYCLLLIIIIIIKKFNRYSKHDKKHKRINATMSSSKDGKAYSTHRRLKCNLKICSIFESPIITTQSFLRQRKWFILKYDLIKLDRTRTRYFFTICASLLLKLVGSVHNTDVILCQRAVMRAGCMVRSVNVSESVGRCQYRPSPPSESLRSHGQWHRAAAASTSLLGWKKWFHSLHSISFMNML